MKQDNFSVAIYDCDTKVSYTDPPKYQKSNKSNVVTDFIIKKLVLWGYLDQEYATYKVWKFTPEKKKRISDALGDYLLNTVDHRKDQVLVIGNETLFEILSEDSPMNNSISFDLAYNYNENGYRRVLGIDVYTVPNISGYALVPKNVIEVKKNVV